MDLKELIESLATGWGERLTILVPLALVAAVGLYMLYLLIGYLRASNTGIEAEAVVGEVIPRETETPGALPAGAPFCPVDGLVHPPGVGLLRAVRGRPRPRLRELRDDHPGDGRDLLQLRSGPIIGRRSFALGQFPISDWT